MYKYTTLFITFIILILYCLHFRFNFRYYQDLEAQRNRFRWVSRKQSDGIKLTMLKSRQKRLAKNAKHVTIALHVIVNAAMMHHHMHLTYLDIT